MVLEGYEKSSIQASRLVLEAKCFQTSEIHSRALLVLPLPRFALELRETLHRLRFRGIDFQDVEANL